MRTQPQEVITKLEADKIMNANKIFHLPIIENKKINGIYFHKIETKIKLKKIKNTFVINAGGRGTRLRPITDNIPKPMIKINKYPLIFHIMKIYAKQGFKDFIIASGYKGEIIEKFFKKKIKDWNVKIVPTGLETMTGGRIKRLKKYLNNERFFLTYGDGVSNLNIKKLLNFHLKSKSTVTLTAVRPPARFGSLNLDGNKVEKFNEKNQSNEGWINGGFFALDKRVCDYIENDNMPFEQEPLERIASEGSLYAYKHAGLFRPVDTIRELELLEKDLLNNVFNF